MGGSALGMIGGAAIGPLIGGMTDYLSHQFSAAQSNKQRRFAREMYEKRYQMTVADLKKAGLNPILAVGGGPGVGPGVTSAGQFSPSRGSPGDVMGGAVRGARLSKELEILRNTAKASKFEEFKADWNAASAREQAWVLRSQHLYIDQQRRNLETQNKLLESEIPSARVKQWFDSTPEGKRLREIRRYIDSLSPFIPRSHFKVR